jgi:hypothetical protein
MMAVQALDGCPTYGLLAETTWPTSVCAELLGIVVTARSGASGEVTIRGDVPLQLL